MRPHGIAALGLASLVMLAGCAPKDPKAPDAPQPTVLTRSSVEPSGAECPVGGVRIDAGVDDGTPGGTARNGTLDPQEIDTTLRICDAAEALVKTTPEPRGVRCAAGGTRVDVGVDDGAGGGTPANGVLEPGEIDQTTWVCNGALCVVSPGGPALDVAVEVSPPPDGQAFVAGDRPAISIRFIDACGATASLGSVSRAQLFLTGPRRGVTATTTAAQLLNCVTDRSAPDRQHHFVDLRSPHYAEPLQQNLAIAPDGLLTYTLAPVTAEAAGTYTAAVWAETVEGAVQLFRLVDLQIGTPIAEPDGFGGIGAGSTCARCHLGPDAGRLQMHHSRPTGVAPLAAGKYALDSAPVAGCAACHNGDGYSANPLVRKVHGVHRGVNQAAPGEAHDDYGLATDPSLGSYLDVRFPQMPRGEKDCAACHADDRWATAPSRLACGTCHDNVRFDAGTLVPPRIASLPGGAACAGDGDCAALGGLLTCNVGSGACERQTHPAQSDDSTCAVCHTATDTGLSPIRGRHEVLERTRVRGLALEDVVLSGGAGSGGSFRVGDVPVLEFDVTAAGASVADLKTNSAMSATLVIAGPTTAPQRVYGPVTMKSSGTLSYDVAQGRYRYVLATGFPAAALAPYNVSGSTPPANPDGTYRVYLYLNESRLVDGTSFREVANAFLDLPFSPAGSPGAPRGREVVTPAACDACHGDLQHHGGGRHDVRGCVTCHTDGAVDRTVGSRGRICTGDAQCPGYAAGWEACVTGICEITVDPTPNRSIALSDLTHRIHAARLLGGYSARADAAPGRVTYVAFSNTLVDFTDRLLSVDPRNCSVCHADSNATCSSATLCSVGQACVSGHCRNTSWTVPSTAACLGCHDTAAAAGHAALQTWSDGVGPSIETCDACHGSGSTASVANAHLLADPSIPPLPRTP